MKQSNLLFLPVLLLLILVCYGCPPDGKDNDPIPPIDTLPPVDTIPLPSPCENLQKDIGEMGIDCGGTECAPCHEVIVENEILIRHLAIVNSDAALNGDLSFGKLMERLSPTDTKEAVKSLVESWSVAQVSNEKSIKARPAVTNKILELWKAKEGATTDEDFEMQLEDAPFRLLAITNRIDLKDEQQSGEGRLTFGLTNGGSNVFTLIFEYQLVGNSKKDFINWAQRWHRLSNLDKDSQVYKDSLIAIVKTFSADSSMLNQVRTNEVLGGIEDATFKWEFREFNLRNNRFVEVSRKKSPDTDLNNTELLERYVTTHSAAILAGNFIEEFEDNKILAGNALYDRNFQWRVPSNDTTLTAALRSLDFMSCVGCHGGLSPNTNFTHIKPRPEGVMSEISPFLEQDVLTRQDSILKILELDIVANKQPVSIATNKQSDSLKVVATDTLSNNLKSINQQQQAKIRKLLEEMKGIPRVH